jgi:methyl-accepting chemotaxis protein
MVKNISVSVKLWLIVLPAILALGGLLFLFITRSNDIMQQSKKALYDETYISTALILNADRDFYQAAVAEKDLLTGELTTSEKEASGADFDENAQQVRERITQAIDNIKSNNALYTQFKHPNTDVTMEQLFATFENEFGIWLESYDAVTGKGDFGGHQAAFDAARESINLMTELLEAYAQSESAQISGEVSRSITIITTVVVIVIAFILVFSTIIILYLRGSIKYITNVSQKIAGGELTIKIDPRRVSRDEIGRLSGATGQILQQLNGYVDYINEITKTLNAMAEGDMRVDLKCNYTGEFQKIKDAFIAISESLGTTLMSIRIASDQVNSGASAISSGAQMLAGGAQEQASAVQQLTASLEVISAQTNQNAKNADQANGLARQAKAQADKGNAHMQEMLGAMEDINQSSSNINKIIKVIDDIAFQTNILALNAAVEAARAGQYGKGFAVVAEEVRTLAAKSANAAKETTDMIENSIRKVDTGTKIAKDTANALGEIVKGIENVAQLVAAISVASNEQALGIEQVNSGITQVSQVVQSNAATAEQSAAASQELSAQATQLRQNVSIFKLDSVHELPGLSDGSQAAAKTPARQLPGKKSAPARPRINLDDGNMGKY